MALAWWFLAATTRSAIEIRLVKFNCEYSASTEELGVCEPLSVTWDRDVIIQPRNKSDQCSENQ